MKNLNLSFERAVAVNKQQEDMLRQEVYKENNVVNTMIQEIMSGSSPSSIKFDARKDFNISSTDADLLYKQALTHIKNDTKWYRR